MKKITIIMILIIIMTMMMMMIKINVKKKRNRKKTLRHVQKSFWNFRNFSAKWSFPFRRAFRPKT